MNQLIDDCSELVSLLQRIEAEFILNDLNKVISSIKNMNNLFKKIIFQVPELEDMDLRTIRHDLYTLLSHILGYTEMLMEDLNKEEHRDVFDYLENILESGKQLHDLIRNLVDFSQLREINIKRLTNMDIQPKEKIIKNNYWQCSENNEKYSILVVDDIEINRKLLKRKLNKFDCFVYEATSGYQALKLLEKNNFDLILLDVMMPGIDGYQVLEELKQDKNLKHIPVIMVSALDEMESVIKCIEIGAEDYLTKPFNSVLLKARINACLEKKRLYDQQQIYQQKIEEYSLSLEYQLRKAKKLYKQLNKELEKAREIHNRNLPKQLPEIKGLNLATYYSPANKIGGDLYDIIRFKDKLLFYLSDVTGHGIDAAMMSVYIKNMIDTYFELHSGDRELKPKQVLNYLIKRYIEENYPLDYFIAIFLGVLDLKETKLRYCSAGMQIAPLLLKGEGEIKELKAGNLPISPVLSKDLLEYQTEEVDLLPGETIFFSSDGLAEQMAAGKCYYDRLKFILRKNSSLKPKDILRVINNDFQDFIANTTKDDDITCLIMQIDRGFL
ncbi:response regulator [Fuchsiella alkaliacetigena]|uniref:response regulator n=1 Tax=Fuchsiella alkaliacetigena TaxID=957042 RepID=UPI00200B3DE5|nr:response regulator [Fuchsiella alkaliacetigena]MCK8824029.1 response regulator [Fuchsiella alkaliacetigena]